MAMLIHLHFVYGCLHPTEAELNSCDQACVACKGLNSYYLDLYRKRFCRPLAWKVRAVYLQVRAVLRPVL